MEAFAIEGLSFTYPTRSDKALSGINLNIQDGEMVVLCGASGCGKTTLLRQLKPALAPHGIRSGEIRFKGRALGELSLRESSAGIGFVTQSPENQVVTDKVWHELAFGLESLGESNATIRLRVAETAAFFGVQSWFHKNVKELSGGQKQLLSLASIMAMQPSALLLDEPTSQLDPIAATEFLQTVAKVNRELGVTVILSEHRLEEAFALATRAVVMDKGEVILDGQPAVVATGLKSLGSSMFRAMPAPMRVWAGVRGDLCCPLNVRDGRKWVDSMAAVAEKPPGRETPAVGGAAGAVAEKPPGRETPAAGKTAATVAVELDELWFRYEKDLPDVVRGTSLKAAAGQITAILGGNGSGKTTLLTLIAGLNKPYRGTVKLCGQRLERIPHGQLFQGLLGLLPQNPQTLFTAKTGRDELAGMLRGFALPKDQRQARLQNIIGLCRLDGLLDAHPYDLSGGEQQRLALAKILLLRPRILLLDEPTKGCDAGFKAVLAGILSKLTDAGAAVVIVSHDIEFCAEHADRCALFFDGAVAAEGGPVDFFSGNSFYTSSANRMARHRFPSAVTVGDLISALGGQPEPYTALLPEDWDDTVVYGIDNLENDLASGGSGSGSAADGSDSGSAAGAAGTTGASPAASASPDAPREPWFTRLNLSPAKAVVSLLALLSLVASIAVAASAWDGLLKFISGGDVAHSLAAEMHSAWKYSALMLWAIISLTALAVVPSWKRKDELDQLKRLPLLSKPLSKRTLIAVVIALLFIPATIYLGYGFFEDRRYYAISLLLIIECMLPFLFIFEGRKPQAREVIIIAVLCAIAVAGRVAFYFVPQFKPVLAVMIIAAVAFGGETGFLVGAVAAFVSNMFIGQGPWTPWQMFALGIIGLLAGILFRKGLLARSPVPLAVFGGLATFIIYGGIMNTASLLIWQPEPTLEKLLAYLIQGIPVDLVHASASVTFLLLISRPMLEKLDRVKLKYGLVE